MKAVQVLESGYAQIYEAVLGWARARGGVQAMFVSGSVANGTADRFSDLDLVIIAPHDQTQALVDEAAAIVDGAEPLIITHRLNPREGICILSVVTAKWHRIDIAFGSAGSGLLRQVLIPAFDPDQLHDASFSIPEPRATTADEVIALATEFFRVLGLSVVANGRGEVHAGHDGANLLRNMLVDLLLLEPPRRQRPSAKKLLPALRAGQQALLRGLPPLADDLVLLNRFSTSVAGAFIPRARRLIESLGGIWPQAVEDATREYLRGTLEF